MNQKQLDKKIAKDAEKVKDDINTLAEHSASRLGGFVNDVGAATTKTKEGINTWVGENVSHLGTDIEKFAGKTKENVIEAAATVKKEVGHGLSVYNDKAQELADKAPGHIGEKAVQYPWVAMTITLALGLLLGGLLKRAFTPLYKLQTGTKIF